MVLFDPRAELLIDGVWTDASTDVQYESGVTITRGRDDQQARISASTCNLTLDNRDGRYSNRNPMSPYYGLLGRNTPLRLRMDGFPSYLHLNGEFASYARTLDAAALDVTGDLDVRVDLQPTSWTPAADQVIASKAATLGNNRSWYLLLLTTGQLQFGWSAAGTFPYETATSTVAVPAGGRLTVRAVLDVVSGANHTVTFYTGTSVTTATTQLGATITAAGATSIYSGNATLEVGTANTGGVVLTTNERLTGKVYRLQLRAGIGGAVVADPDFSALDPGDTLCVDGLNTWNVFARVSNDGYRFHGEVSSFPPKWDLSGNTVWTAFDAAGITRRLTQGASPLRSPMYRSLARFDPAGWWPLEDGADATAASSAVTDGVPATAFNIGFAGDDTLPGAETAAVITDVTSRLSGTVRRTIGGTGWSFTFAFKLPSLPGAETTLISWTATGTLPRWEVAIGPSWYHVTAYNTSDVLIVDSTVGFGDAVPTDWVIMMVDTAWAAGTVTWRHQWHAYEDVTSLYDAHGTYAGTPGTVRSWAVIGQFYLNGASLSHVYTGENTIPFFDDNLALAANGYRGETALTRLRRLCAEEGVALVVDRGDDHSAPMGRQGVATFMDLLVECAEADVGILGEARDQLALEYRPRTDLYNQAGPTFDYGAGHIAEPFEPADDDQAIRNDVTVSRPAGGTSRFVVESGPLSVLAPPNGVGRYDTAVDLNVHTDGQLPDLAAWLAHLNTWDDLRYPSISFKLNNSAFTGDADLTGQVAELDMGDVFTVDNMPPWLPPDPPKVMVQGTAERITPHDWDVTTNTTPGALWDPAVEGVDKYDTDGSELATGVSSSAVTFSVAVTAGDLWDTDPAECPIRMKLGGEEVLVTVITGASSPQTFTVTRAVNGIVKAHLAGTDIRLAKRPFYAL